MLTVREYGRAGATLIVLHGGPGAAGYMAPVARQLSDGFRVLEPLQRRSNAERLTVARHVADLCELIQGRNLGRPPLVGSSWGAMLALAFAAEHPQLAGPLVLIGSGTFDKASRRRMQTILEERTDERLRQSIQRLNEAVADPDERLRRLGELLLPAYVCDPLATGWSDGIECDARGHRETWDDMLRQQAAGVFPAAFAAIESPVLMLHGAADPHPGEMIRDSLLPHVPQLEYREWPECGHYPWLERGVRDQFFQTLRTWLASRLKTTCPQPISTCDWLGEVRDGRRRVAWRLPDGGWSAALAGPIRGLLSGSFNPLHAGHRELRNVAEQLLGGPVYYELPILNADKPPLDDGEIGRRFQQFREHPLAISNAATFADKAAIFPQTTFVVGYDTAVRIVDPRFYGDNVGRMGEALARIRSAGCTFLVACRAVDGVLRRWHDVPAAERHGDLFAEIPPDQFRRDVSSTEHRRRAEA